MVGRGRGHRHAAHEALLEDAAVVDHCGSADDADAITSAARALLGDQLERITRSVGEHWSGLIAPGWKERHAHATQVAAELGKLPPIEAAAAPDGSEPGAIETLWKKAAALMDLEGDAAVQPILDQIGRAHV